MDLTGSDSVAADPNHNKALGREVAAIILGDSVEELRELARRLPDLKFSRYAGDWDRGGIYTPIASAVAHNKMDVFEFLINKAVLLEEQVILGFWNGRRRNGTVLSLAVRVIHFFQFQAIKYAEILCKSGANVHADVVSTEQPLAVLLQSSDQIADPQLFKSAMELACLFISILQRNNEINEISKDGLGYIHDRNLHPWVLKMLLVAGADKGLRTRDTSITPLHALLHAKHAPELLRILIEEYDCDVNEKDAQNQNALQRILHTVQQKRLVNPLWTRTIQVLFDNKINVDFLVGDDARFFSDLNRLPQFKKIRAYRVMPLVVWNLLQLGHPPQFLEPVDMNLLPMNNTTTQIHEFLERDRDQREAAITSASNFFLLPDELRALILHESTFPFYKT